MPLMTTITAKPIVEVGGVRFGNQLPICLIAGPCALESREHAFDMAGALKAIADRLGIGFVYKTSFDKANRTSLCAKRGLGLDKALAIFADIRGRLAVPGLTDVHESAQCAPVAQVADILQIPAFLCRQTDLLIAAARTGRVVNIKKGQFLAPWDMENVVAKITGAGNKNVLVTERGVSFGYNTLVADLRSLPIMAKTTGAPVIFDATHSVQQPGGRGSSSGGQREFVPVLARAAVAVGVAGIFVETHRDPDSAPSDGPNMLPLDRMEQLLSQLVRVRPAREGGRTAFTPSADRKSTLGRSARVEFDDEIWFHLHRIGHIRKRRHPSDLRGHLGVVGLDIIGHISLGKRDALEHYDKLLRCILHFYHVAGLDEIARDRHAPPVHLDVTMVDELARGEDSWARTRPDK